MATKKKVAPTRRARGEVPHTILRFLETQEPYVRLTPYAIAKSLGLPRGSATAAVKRLIESDRVTCYGDAPLVIGRKVESDEATG